MSMFKKQGRELFLDLVVCGGWLLYASIFLHRVLSGGGVRDLGLVVFFTLLALFFVIRHPARKSGAPWETVLALVGTFLPAVVPRPAPGGLLWLGEGIQTISVAGMVVALISIGRSFAITPADRGLRTTGFYRWLRHPLYAMELSFYVGYLVANPSWRNLIALLLGTAIQIMRIWREERILAGYANYALQVRWRLIPFVW